MFVICIHLWVFGWLTVSCSFFFSLQYINISAQFFCFVWNVQLSRTVVQCRYVLKSVNACVVSHAVLRRFTWMLLFTCLYEAKPIIFCVITCSCVKTSLFFALCMCIRVCVRVYMCVHECMLLCMAVVRCPAVLCWSALCYWCYCLAALLFVVLL